MSIVANILFATSSLFSSKKVIFTLQFFESITGAIAQILVRGYSAAAQLFVCAIRNIITGLGVKSKSVYWLFCIFFIISGLSVNKNGLIGLLSIFATVQYTLWMCYCKSAQQLRIGIILNIIPWMIHDFYMQIYTSVILMAISLLVTFTKYIHVARVRNMEGEFKC